MFKEGDRVLIGGKEASRRNYTTVVGQVGVYHKEEATESHAVRIETMVWFIEEVDLIPLGADNDSMVALLHTEDL